MAEEYLRLAQLVTVPLLIGGSLMAQIGSPGQYQGPAILSRGATGKGQPPGQLFNLRFFANVAGTYDTGLTPVSTDSHGNLVDVGPLKGVEADFGVLGYRRWQHSTLGVDYRGSFRHYTPNSFYDGTNQDLVLDYSNQLTRHVVLTLRESAGLHSRVTDSITGAGFVNPATVGVPANEVFDGRTAFGQTSVILGYQMTPRFSIVFEGDGYIVRRHSRALAGLNGASAIAGAAYRVSRVSTIVGNYVYSHFEFPGLFGSSDLHGISLGYQRALGQHWQVGLEAGALRAETKGLTLVALDPAIAAIIGRNFGIGTYYRLLYIPSVNARLSRNFRTSNLTFNATEGASPGNGIYLTSRTQTATSYYSYTGLKRWNLGVNGQYSKMSSIAQTLGRFTSVGGGAGVTYRMGLGSHIIVRYDAFHYTTQDARFDRTSNRVMAGIGFSPGELPLSLW